MENPGPTDAELLAAVTALGPEAGDAWRDAWAAVYEAYRAMLWRVASRIVAVGDTEREVTPDDVIHTVMLKMMAKGLPGVVPSLRAYMITAVKNAATDAVRKDNRTRTLAGQIGPIAAGNDMVDPEALALRAIRDEEVRSACGVLTDRERYVVEHRLMRQEPAADVANALGVSQRWVRSLVASALEKLRPVLASVENGSEETTPGFDHDVEQIDDEMRGGEL